MLTPNLTFTHLRFDLIALTRVKLGRVRVGQRLRDALASTMLRMICPEINPGEHPSAEHLAICPVCQLLTAETERGQVRRAYAVVPPPDPPDVVEAGERFSFGLTLFGRGFQYLPYFILAVRDMGSMGLGPGRGRLDLSAVWAGNPLSGCLEPVLYPGETTVHVPREAISWDHVQTIATQLRPQLERDKYLRLRFLSPTRLIYDQTLVKTADFSVFFRRLLERIDHLRQQFGDETGRPAAEVDKLYTLADRVRLVEDQTRWCEVSGWSGRQRRKQWLSGFIGTATYHAHEWETLLPWLILGQATQVGKLTAKGNGVYEIDISGLPPYWAWLSNKAPIVN